ncbi:MAG: hypothetical protein KQI35_17905 [Bacteroidetes bacterium]|nr:hypothetical protein [Bacteroidota bacterium]
MNRFRKKYKVILFAFFLTLMHAFIPHVHSHPNTAVAFDTHELDTDIFKVLTRSLSFNLGNHHLENFKDAGNQDIVYFDHASLQFIEFDSVAHISQEKYPRPDHEFPPPYLFILSRHVNRGPPLLV